MVAAFSDTVTNARCRVSQPIIPKACFKLFQLSVPPHMLLPWTLTQRSLRPPVREPGYNAILAADSNQQEPTTCIHTSQFDAAFTLPGVSVVRQLPLFPGRRWWWRKATSASPAGQGSNWPRQSPDERTGGGQTIWVACMAARCHQVTSRCVSYQYL